MLPELFHILRHFGTFYPTNFLQNSVIDLQFSETSNLKNSDTISQGFLWWGRLGGGDPHTNQKIGLSPLCLPHCFDPKTLILSFSCNF